MKRLTNNETSSKAILQIVHRYPALLDRVTEQAAQIDELKRELGHCRRLLQNYTQSLNQLHGLADKLVNDSLGNGE